MDIYDIVGYLHFIIGFGYFTFGIIVVFLWGNELLKWLMPQKSRIKNFIIISILGTVAFFFGCGEHHLHMGWHMLTRPDMFDLDFVNHMFWSNLFQVIGVWGPLGIVFYTRRIFKKFKNTYQQR